MKLEDKYPFIKGYKKKTNLGLRYRTKYMLEQHFNNYKSFVSKKAILNKLEGKSYYDITRCKGIGPKMVEELTKWIKDNGEEE